MLKIQLEYFEEVVVVQFYPFDANLFDNITCGQKRQGNQNRLLGDDGFVAQYQTIKGVKQRVTHTGI